MDTKKGWEGEEERESEKRRGNEAEKGKERGGLTDRRFSKSVFDDGDSRRSPESDP